MDKVKEIIDRIKGDFSRSAILPGIVIGTGSNLVSSAILSHNWKRQARSLENILNKDREDRRNEKPQTPTINLILNKEGSLGYGPNPAFKFASLPGEIAGGLVKGTAATAGFGARTVGTMVAKNLPLGLAITGWRIGSRLHPGTAAQRNTFGHLQGIE